MPNYAGQLGEKCHPGRAKEVETLLGPITLRQRYFYNESTDACRAPLDDALGLVNGHSPSVVLPSDLKSDPIPVFYVEVDGTGVRMDRAELAGRKGKKPDGTAKTREAKLGCVSPRPNATRKVFRSTITSRRPMSAAFKTAPSSAASSAAEAFRRGLGRAVQVGLHRRRRVLDLGTGPGQLSHRHADPRPVPRFGANAHLVRWSLRRRQRLGQANGGPVGAGVQGGQGTRVISAARSRLADLGDQPDGPDSLDKQIA